MTYKLIPVPVVYSITLAIESTILTDYRAASVILPSQRYFVVTLDLHGVLK